MLVTVQPVLMTIKLSHYMFMQVGNHELGVMVQYYKAVPRRHVWSLQNTEYLMTWQDLEETEQLPPPDMKPYGSRFHYR